jgi:hypothetical protein
MASTLGEKDLHRLVAPRYTYDNDLGIHKNKVEVQNNSGKSDLES